MNVTDEMVEEACRAFSEGYAVYPDGEAETRITDWFDLDAQDAVDFGVLKEPKWDGYSDIRGMQHEWYIAAVVRHAMRTALTAALSTISAQEPVAWMRPVTITRMDGTSKTLWLANETDHDAIPVYRDAPCDPAALSAMEGEAGNDGRCPRPCNGRPADFTMRSCIEAGECGCIAFPSRGEAGTPSPVDHVMGMPTFWVWRIPGGEWQASEAEPSASVAVDVDCYQTGAALIGRVETLELALKPFADIAPCVEYTDKRDGDIVHRQDVVLDGRRIGWKELTKDDFRRAAAAIASSPTPRVSR